MSGILINPYAFGTSTPPEPSIVTDGLIGNYDADNTSTSSWTDLAAGITGQDHTLTLTNTTYASIGGINAFYTNGTNAYFGVNASYTGDVYKINTMLDYTMEIWYRSSGSYINTGNLFNFGYNQGSRLRFDSSGNSWVYAPSISTGNLGGAWATNTWFQLVVTMENLGSTNDSLKVYKNTVLVGTDTTGNYNPTDSTTGILFGSYNSSSERGRFFYSIIRRYNRPLSSAEITQNYDVVKSRFGY